MEHFDKYKRQEIEIFVRQLYAARDEDDKGKIKTLIDFSCENMDPVTVEVASLCDCMRVYFGEVHSNTMEVAVLSALHAWFHRAYIGGGVHRSKLDFGELTEFLVEFFNQINKDRWHDQRDKDMEATDDE